jgi:hypothetical protein
MDRESEKKKKKTGKKGRKEGSGKNMPHRYSGLPKALDTVAILG